MLHLFNYSVNIEDHLLANGVGICDEFNEIETIAELFLTIIFQEDGILPDEANDINKIKGPLGEYEILQAPITFNFKRSMSDLSESTRCQYYLNRYLNLVYDICPPPPKTQV